MPHDDPKAKQKQRVIEARDQIAALIGEVNVQLLLAAGFDVIRRSDFLNFVLSYTRSLDAITGAIREKWPRAIVRTRETAYESGAELGAVGLGKHNTLVERPASVALALCLAAVRLAMAEEGK